MYGLNPKLKLVSFSAVLIAVLSMAFGFLLAPYPSCQCSTEVQAVAAGDSASCCSLSEVPEPCCKSSVSVSASCCCPPKVVECSCNECTCGEINESSPSDFPVPISSSSESAVCCAIIREVEVFNYSTGSKRRLGLTKSNSLFAETAQQKCILLSRFHC